MNELDKLRILLSHWIEHNKEHAEELQRWVEKAGAASGNISLAAQYMNKASEALRTALNRLGGEMEQHH